jgi:hypothetical protein
MAHKMNTKYVKPTVRCDWRQLKHPGPQVQTYESNVAAVEEPVLRRTKMREATLFLGTTV